ncbi:unnamed protein product [Effrenium voratum]|uniref:Uncharacterized protein n=1 Tax=Effrenium voratum TaxID=2562239 RepID=A0AA36I5N1_9DINO|nr:unnamed protein product [Effrenium voratum]CAJ1438692.1 unnamed protein product [Effrenium voratum]
MNEMVLVDAPFTEVGDDVTLDYDGQVRCHSFKDVWLKFTTFKIGHGMTIMTGASVAMCDAGDGATLRPGSLTWKEATWSRAASTRAPRRLWTWSAVQRS